MLAMLGTIAFTGSGRFGVALQGTCVVSAKLMVQSVPPTRTDRPH